MRLAERVTAVAVIALLTLLLLEIVLRVATSSGSLAGVPLRPFDPASPIEAARTVDFSKSYLVFDPELGWTLGASRHSTNGLYRSTSFGARSDDEASEPEAGAKVWALAFGDSFTHGDDVAADATWEHELARSTGRPLINFGVPGYGVDQALLRYRRVAARWPSDLVLIGLMSDNIGRHVNRYRPFISPTESLFFAKPRFLYRGGNLELLPQPFRRLEDYFVPDVRERLHEIGRQDDWYRPEDYEPSAGDAWRTARVVRSLVNAGRSTERWRSLYSNRDAVELTLRVVEEFVAGVRADHRQAIVLFFPDKSFCLDAMEGRPSLAAALLGSLRRDDIRVIDLTRPLIDVLSSTTRPADQFIPHYSAELNRRVGSYLAKELGAAATPKSLPQ